MLIHKDMQFVGVCRIFSKSTVCTNMVYMVPVGNCTVPACTVHMYIQYVHESAKNW